MSNFTTSFALALIPTWFNVVDMAVRRRVDWKALAGGKYSVSIDRVAREFDSEFDAWNHVMTEFPRAIELLKTAEHLIWRGYALRAEMMLGVGERRMAEMTNDLYKEVFRIYELALESLDAVRVAKAVPKVTRVTRSRAVSWLEVRTNVQLPYQSGPSLLSVRCLPSPVDDNTWSVRLRVPAKSDIAILETQQRFEDLVTKLSYQGIKVKDVQNGTCFDL